MGFISLFLLHLINWVVVDWLTHLNWLWCRVDHVGLVWIVNLLLHVRVVELIRLNVLDLMHLDKVIVFVMINIAVAKVLKVFALEDFNVQNHEERDAAPNDVFHRVIISLRS